MRNPLLIAVTILVIACVGMVQTAYAADSSDKCIKGDKRCQSTFFDTNSIYLYNPLDTESTACSAVNGTAGTVGSIKTLEKSDTLEHIFQTLLNGGLNAVQAAAVMGNMYHESGFNPAQEEIGNNHAGYGLAQWSYGRRTNLEAYAKSQGTSVSNLDMQLKFLLNEYNSSYKARLSSTAFDKGTVVKDATTAWMRVFEAPALLPPNDPAGLNSARIPAANTIYGFYSTLAPTTTATGLDPVQPDCGSADGTNSGSIIDTALSLAWPQSKGIVNGDNQPKDATDAYQKAKPKYAPGGEISDCGAFVATVIRMSGTDPDFPQLHVTEQDKYVRAHPEKYQIIENAKVTQLQPGDLIIQNDDDHIVISQGANKPNIDASNMQRVPSVRPNGSDLAVINNQGNPKGAFIARYIGAPSGDQEQ